MTAFKMCDNLPRPAIYEHDLCPESSSAFDFKPNDSCLIYMLNCVPKNADTEIEVRMIKFTKLFQI